MSYSRVESREQRVATRAIQESSHETCPRAVSRGFIPPFEGSVPRLDVPSCSSCLPLCHSRGESSAPADHANDKATAKLQCEAAEPSCVPFEDRVPRMEKALSGHSRVESEDVACTKCFTRG